MLGRWFPVIALSQFIFYLHRPRHRKWRGTCSRPLWYFYGSAFFFCPSDLIRHLSTSCVRANNALNFTPLAHTQVVGLPASPHKSKYIVCYIFVISAKPMVRIFFFRFLPTKHPLPSYPSSRRNRVKGSQHKDPDPAMLATDRGGSIATRRFLFFLFPSIFRGRERKGKTKRRKNNKGRKKVKIKK